MPTPSPLPPVTEKPPGAFTAPEAPAGLVGTDAADSESGTPWSGVDTEAAIKAIGTCATVLEATHLDEATLLRRLAVQWTPESAMKECEWSDPNLSPPTL